IHRVQVFRPVPGRDQKLLVMKKKEATEEPQPEKPNEDFTKQEILEIREMGTGPPAVKKLADRYALLFSEPEKSFFAAFAFASKQIENHIFNGTIDPSNKKQR